jgi:hypothetical protein
MKRNQGDFGTVSLEDRTVLKRNDAGEAIEWKNDGNFYFRCRSFVNITEKKKEGKGQGQPLAERKQQKVLIAAQDTSIYKNLKSSALHIEAGKLGSKIIAWETAATNGQVVEIDGTIPQAEEQPKPPSSDIPISEFSRRFSFLRSAGTVLQSH